MAQVSIDTEREHRISMEAIVDAYDAEERALGWYYYLKKKYHFLFCPRAFQKEPQRPCKQGIR